MTKTASTILERLSKNSFPMQELFTAKKNAYLAPLADLILASEQIAAQALEPWEFKSLAQMGREEFILTANIYKFDEWAKDAQKSLADSVSRHIYYEENEGLLFFIQVESGKYRVARLGDPAYDFVRRLNAEDAVSDSRFTKPPTWAEELFLGHENFEAYKLMWHDDTHFPGPQYKASKKLRADAVIRETWRRMGEVPGLSRDPDPIGAPLEKMLTTTERNTLLTIIAALCDYSAIKHQERGAAGLIAKMAEEIGAPVTDDTIRKTLAKIPDALEARMK